MKMSDKRAGELKCLQFTTTSCKKWQPREGKGDAPRALKCFGSP